MKYLKRSQVLFRKVFILCCTTREVTWLDHVSRYSNLNSRCFGCWKSSELQYCWSNSHDVFLWEKRHTPLQTITDCTNSASPDTLIAYMETNYNNNCYQIRNIYSSKLIWIEQICLTSNNMCPCCFICAPILLTYFWLGANFITKNMHYKNMKQCRWRN